MTTEATVKVAPLDSEELNASRGGNSKDKGPESRSSIIERLRAIKAEQAVIKQSKKHIIEKQEQLNDQISKISNEIKSLKSKLPHHTIARAEKELSALEAKLEKGNLKLVEEKQIFDEIHKINRSKKNILTLETLENDIKSKKSELNEVYKQLHGTNALALSEEFTKLSEKLDQLKAKTATEASAVSAVNKKRDEIRDKINELYTEKRAAFAEYKEASNKYFVWSQEQKKLKYEQEKSRRLKENNERILSKAKEELELASIPAYEDEISICNNLMSYLHSNYNVGSLDALATSKPNPSADNSKNLTSSNNIRAPDTTSNVLEGARVLPSKKDREDAFFVGNASKGKKKSAKNSNPKSSSNKQGLRFPLSILDSFNTLKITPPGNTSELPDVVSKITELRDSFLKDQERATKEKKAKIEEEISKLMAELNTA
ncbi:hypothetical protein BB560_001231 [Smittium megazygosporum]|uniref:Nuclear segregation protein Bfr1 n=1 Tax=Smittium megazygosporum TaxID=133381 RepID=A0A2T9ZI62_9FUNG|nr:hypothetical protein BB560_001231 [Smittium megazygosporum]